VDTPVSTNAHHCQLPARPNLRTCSVTQFGVSLLNVVATIDNVFLLARFAKNSAGTKQIKSEPATMIQSSGCSCMFCGIIRRASGVRPSASRCGVAAHVV
jgi:hypothetical protein